MGLLSPDIPGFGRLRAPSLKLSFLQENYGDSMLVSRRVTTETLSTKASPNLKRPNSLGELRIARSDHADVRRIGYAYLGWGFGMSGFRANRFEVWGSVRVAGSRD